MKIHQFIITILISVIFGQFSANTINGFGNSTYTTMPSCESMGNMWTFNNKASGWNPLLASSLFRTDLTTFSILSSFEGVSADTYQVDNHLINFVSFSFPIRKNAGFSFALSPYAKTDYNIFDSDYNIIEGTKYSNPLASKNAYEINGGISKLSLSFSRAFWNQNFALGFKWSVLFGNQTIKTTTILSEISYDQSQNQIFTDTETLINEEYNHFHAYSYELDWNIKNNNNNFSVLINFLDNFKVNRYESPQNYIINKNYLFDQIELDRFAIGYMYRKDNNFGLGFEGHFKNQIKYPESIMILNNLSPSEISFHNGIYKIIDNVKVDSWNSVNLSSGYSYKIIKFNERDLDDISFSIGLGFLFNKRHNNIELAFTVGSRESIIETINRESYYKVNIGILSGDKWFVKRREK